MALVAPNSKNNQPITLLVVELLLSESIRQLSRSKQILWWLLKAFLGLIIIPQYCQEAIKVLHVWGWFWDKFLIRKGQLFVIPNIQYHCMYCTKWATWNSTVLFCTNHPKLVSLWSLSWAINPRSTCTREINKLLVLYMNFKGQLIWKFHVILCIHCLYQTMNKLAL